MSKFSLSDSKLSNDALLGIFYRFSRNDRNLEIIFELALNDKTLFPSFSYSSKVGSLQTLEEQYIQKWCNAYLEFKDPSLRGVKNNDSPDDPALIKLIESYANISLEETSHSLKQHNMWMQAENIQGELLEEYIAKKTALLGWIWCKGSILRAVDFINKDGEILLQIKNKYNTENSSSSAIRDRKNIIKWFRLGVKKKNGLSFAVFKWDELNEIIDIGGNKLSPSNMSEVDYESFLAAVSKANPELLKALH